MEHCPVDQNLSFEACLSVCQETMLRQNPPPHNIGCRASRTAKAVNGRGGGFLLRSFGATGRFEQEAALSRFLVSTLITVILAGAALPLSAQESEHGISIVSSENASRADLRDIEQFRTVANGGGFLPKPDALSIEGLLGDYDLEIPSQRVCGTTLCLTGQSKRAELHARPQDTHFFALTLESGLESGVRAQEPISLVLVADRSGSMDGSKIKRERAALRAIIGQLDDTDRVALVSFDKRGRTDMPMVEVGPNRGIIGNAINALVADGETHMETGLAQGFQLAAAEQVRTGRKTRVMLLTDELPNANSEQPAGFMGMTRVAADKKSA